MNTLRVIRHQADTITYRLTLPNGERFTKTVEKTPNGYKEVCLWARSAGPFTQPAPHPTNLQPTNAL